MGVRVGGIAVGGLSAEPARAHVEAAFKRSVRVSYRGQTTLLTPEALGAGPSIDDAVTAALAATPSSRIALPAHASQSKIAGAREQARPSV